MLFSVHDVDNAESQSGHYPGCKEHAEENARDRGLGLEFEQRRDERARPCACAGERDADEQQQCDGAVLLHLFTLEVSLGLELRDEAVHLRPVPAQPYEHALDEDDNERHGDHVPDDRRRQRQRIIKTEGDGSFFEWFFIYSPSNSWSIVSQFTSYQI